MYSCSRWGTLSVNLSITACIECKNNGVRMLEESVRIAPSLRLSDESLPLQALHSDIRHPDAVGTGNAVRHFQCRESKDFQKRQIDRHHRLHLWEAVVSASHSGIIKESLLSVECLILMDV
jgi:hypothetical protein